MSMSVMPASINVHHVSGASIIQKRVSDFLELEFNTVGADELGSSAKATRVLSH